MTYDQLKLENQLCFPLYAAAKEVVRRYTPLLTPLGLTYTQYLVLLVLWDTQSMSVKDLGDTLFLDSGTLTPVLKRLEKQGYIHRNRSKEDERILIASLTADGEKLKEKASEIPVKMATCVPLKDTDAKELYRILYELLGKISACNT
ncbi:MAG TPA: MarR family transcriptional regulator [Treponemataceae bacterium]|jgi:DNA-binding MarR family transcriptional regulator|nr:MarR family transcriptional regulator [Treponemataceae bacterium]